MAINHAKREGSQKMNFWVKIAVALYVLFVLILSVGCKSINSAPISKLYVLDLDNDVCSTREITDKKTLSSKRIAEGPAEDCDGIIGLSPEEFSNLRTYMRDQN